MSKFSIFFCASLCMYSGFALQADAPLNSEGMPEFPKIESVQFPIEEATSSSSTLSEPKVAPKKVVDKIPEVNVNPFTGKVKGRKVRMRLRPDLDSRIIKELVKNDLVTVIGEKGDFWAVEPPADTKVYVFRSFILDNVVEGNHVNVRLEPSLDAPIVAHLNSGEKLEDPIISPVNTKWLEIAPPPQTRFYIAKEYIDYAGGPEVKAQMDRRLATAEQLLDATSLLSKAEFRKPFDEIDFDRIVKGYNTIINDYNEFPDLVDQAKEALATFQDSYLQRRISFLESQPADRYADAKASKKGKLENVTQITDKMKLWEPIEESLYLSWANINENRTQREYYEEQKLGSVSLTGIVEAYTHPAKHKPGDFILRDKDSTAAYYIYSTQINLQSLVGKQVSLTAAPRPNNNFAFKAFYVLSVD